MRPAVRGACAIAAACLGLLLAACDRGPTAVAWSEAERAQIISLSLANLAAPPPDPSNAYADDPRAVALGRRLFSDPRLSRNGQVACATCHQPARLFTDGLPTSRGLGTARRHAPSLLTAAWSPWLFWDGRADSLWSQVLGPLQDPVEMGLTLAEVATVIAGHYRADYQALFGRMPSLQHPAPVSIKRIVTNVGKALAAFERSLRPAPAPFDAYAEALRRNDARADSLLDADERAGLRLFLGRGQCLRCHHGPLLTNHGFHNTGLGSLIGQAFDRGRADGVRVVLTSEFNCRGPYSDASSSNAGGSDAAARPCAQLEYARTGAAELVGAFRTPSLRNVAVTAPYMHDGRFAELGAVLDHYNRAPQLGMEYGHTELFPLGLSEAELGQLEAFLRTLTSAEPTLAGMENSD
ncbi:MAG: cytochrome-c peroxidase [Nevskiales bacterium]